MLQTNDQCGRENALGSGCPRASLHMEGQGALPLGSETTNEAMLVKR